MVILKQVTAQQVRIHMPTVLFFEYYKLNKAVSKAPSVQTFPFSPFLSLLSASVRYVSVISQSCSFSSLLPHPLCGKKTLPDLPVTKATCLSWIPQSSSGVNEMDEMREDWLEGKKEGDWRREVDGTSRGRGRLRTRNGWESGKMERWRDGRSQVSSHL